MKRYKLLKDLPLYPAGTICEIQEQDFSLYRDCRESVVKVEDDSFVEIINPVELRKIREDSKFDEWFEEVKSIKLPVKIESALHEWLDAQDETFTGLYYWEYASAIEFWAFGVSITFSADKIDGLETGREYTLEELGLEG